MKILGISAYYHDSAAAISINGSVIAAAQEERFTRVKQDSSFPNNATKYCLEYAGVGLSQLDAVVFYDKPLLKFERLLETYYAFAPKGIRSFLTAIPVWIKEKLFLKKMLLEELNEVQEFPKGFKPNLLFPEHHLSHAASAYYPSHFDEATILTIDGVGEWATASICHGKGKKITILRELRFPHSVGLLYSAFTYFLGFKVNSGEYKLMGLAPYGNPNSERTQKFVEIIKSELIDVHDDGSIWLNQEYFDYAAGLKMVNEGAWERLFSIPARRSETDLEQVHCDLGMAIQSVTEEIVLKMTEEAVRLTGCRSVCMAGGVALNCVANGKLLRSGLIDDLYIHPAAGDAGGALGAALAGHYIHFGQERTTDRSFAIASSYLGPEYSDLEIEQVARKYNAPFEKAVNDTLYEKVAKKLADGNVVGWFQGRMEWGPRALGNRSILGDARNPDMQKKLNLKIKYRESFRPFAPSVLAEDVQDYFHLEGVSPYMLLVTDIAEERKRVLPNNYHDLPLKEKLYYLRSDIPAVTHLDYSARVQTVHQETNPQYWNLLNAFKELTGYSLLVNTSFNVRGEPIVMSPNDAFKCFMRTEMDYLILGNYIFDKSSQIAWDEKEDWRNEYALD